ncbi:MULTISPECIES: hypothetical protein [unclassified Kribbella]|uniref:hypothetical protein n=1 Tax=unclassified Kribbella TaxID=2644121 RepID=UPI00301AE80B
MSSPPHLDAGRIYRLAPFEEVVTELRKTFANAPSVLPPQPAPTQRVPAQRVPAQRVPAQRVPAQRVPAQRVAIGNGRPPVTSAAAGEAPFVLLGDDDLAGRNL